MEKNFDYVTARKSILNTFSNVASGLGYSELHGKILGILYVSKEPVSIQEIAKETHYSLSTISLSIDFLEVLGIIKKTRLNADRKLYVEMTSDLFDCLKKAVLIKLERNVNGSLVELQKQKNLVPETEEGKKVMQTILSLEDEIKKIKKFTDFVNNMQQ